MSESDIIAACEAYINRSFDEEDVRDLRKFLSSLQKQRTPKPVVEKKPEKLALKTPSLPRSTSVSDSKPSYVKEYNEVDTSALREERLAEIKGPGVKDRLGNWQEKIAHAEETTTQTDPNLKAERLAEIKGAGVKDRLGNWQEKIAHAEESTPQTDPNLKAERLAEIKGAGVKDRLGNWQEKIATTEESTPQTDPNLKAERLADLKTGTGLKDRLGAYQAKVSQEEQNESKAAERLAELKAAQGVKDRLGAYQAATSATEAELKKNNERPAELQHTSSVKDRLNTYVSTAEDNTVKNKTVVDDEVKKISSVSSRLANWNKVAEEVDKPITTDTTKVAERTAEAKAGPGIKDRVNVWSAEAHKEPEVKRKEPIKIDYGF